jgi:short chain dehydrogenase
MVQANAEKHQTRVWYYSCDITDEGNIRQAFASAFAAMRFPLRGFVACAGISGGGPTLDFSMDRARSIVDVNFLGTLACCQVVGRQFQKQQLPASVVLVASMSGHGSNKVRTRARYGPGLQADIASGGRHCSLQRFQVCSPSARTFLGCGMGFSCGNAVRACELVKPRLHQNSDDRGVAGGPRNGETVVGRQYAKSVVLCR